MVRPWREVSRWNLVIKNNCAPLTRAVSIPTTLPPSVHTTNKMYNLAGKDLSFSIKEEVAIVHNKQGDEESWIPEKRQYKALSNGPPTNEALSS